MLVGVRSKLHRVRMHLQMSHWLCQYLTISQISGKNILQPFVLDERLNTSKYKYMIMFASCDHTGIILVRGPPSLRQKLRRHSFICYLNDSAPGIFLEEDNQGLIENPCPRDFLQEDLYAQ